MNTVSEQITALIQAAESGAGAAGQELGDRFRQGDGVPEDYVQALHWYGVGARLGDADAQNNLGSMLLDGLGCIPDVQAAIGWYAASAAQSHRVAQYNLGKRYLHIDGVDRDDSLAFYWIGLSARQGYPEALCELGTLYRFGRGTPPDVLQAVEYHILASETGDVVAQGNLCDEEASLLKFALEGNRQAAFALCRMLSGGFGVERNPSASWGWLRWAHDGCEPLPEQADAWGINGGVVNAMRFYLDILDGETRKEGERLLGERLVAAGREPEGALRTILQVGCEGGDITLSGRWTADGWRFLRKVYDWTPELLDEPAIAHELEDIGSWRSALKAMDRYPWHDFYPLAAHPEFANRIWQARQRRRHPGDSSRHNEDWARVCGRTGPGGARPEDCRYIEPSSNVGVIQDQPGFEQARSASQEIDPYVARARKVLEMVAVLHEMGYERLRIFPEIASTGMAWKCMVLPAGFVSEENGARPAADMEPDGETCIQYSTWHCDNHFGWIDTESAEVFSPQQLAKRIISEYPDFVRQGRGADVDYVTWYREMLKLTAPANLPWATSDAQGDDEYMRPGKLSTSGPQIDLWLEMPPSVPEQ